MSEGVYQPSEEEIFRAEGTITEEQRAASLARERLSPEEKELMEVCALGFFDPKLGGFEGEIDGQRVTISNLFGNGFSAHRGGLSLDRTEAKHLYDKYKNIAYVQSLEDRAVGALKKFNREAKN